MSLGPIKALGPAVLLLLPLLAGCHSVVDLPYVQTDGTITGGEPRLHALISLVSQGRPRPATDSISPMVSYVITVLPIVHMVRTEGTFPREEAGVEAPYTLIACLGSSNSAQVAIVTAVAAEVRPSANARPPPMEQQTGVFRWENGQWVSHSLPGLQLRGPPE